MNRSGSTNNQHRIADIAVLLILCALVILYIVDAVNASTDVLNLILVLPVTAIVLGLCLVQFVSSLRGKTELPPPAEPVSDVLPVMVLFAAYVLSLHWLGFDIGTTLFLGAFLWMQGERRWPWLLGYSIGFAFLLAVFFSKMLPYPMPMLLLESVY